MNLSKLAGALVKAKRPYCTAVIVAAGSSSRMGGTDKLSASLGGKPVLLRTLQVFPACPCIDEIVVVVRTVHKAAQVGAAAPAIPLKDTIKRVGKGVVVETPPREELVGIQTPQVFDKDFIEGALFQALEQGILLTDDCSAAERLGMAVHLTEGSEKNVKITTPLDLALANLIWEERQV